MTQPNLLTQSIQHKIEIVRDLRQLMSRSIHWVGGEALVKLSEAIAEVESEIEELTDDTPELNLHWSSEGELWHVRPTGSTHEIQKEARYYRGNTLSKSAPLDGFWME